MRRPLALVAFSLLLLSAQEARADEFTDEGRAIRGLFIGGMALVGFAALICGIIFCYCTGRFYDRGEGQQGLLLVARGETGDVPQVVPYGAVDAAPNDGVLVADYISIQDSGDGLFRIPVGAPIGDSGQVPTQAPVPKGYGQPQ